MKDSTKEPIGCSAQPVRAASGEQQLEDFLDLVAKLIARAHVRRAVESEKPDVNFEDGPPAQRAPSRI
jgi:hypothetical protein